MQMYNVFFCDPSNLVVDDQEMSEFILLYVT